MFNLFVDPDLGIQFVRIPFLVLCALQELGKSILRKSLWGTFFPPRSLKVEHDLLHMWVRAHSLQQCRIDGIRQQRQLVKGNTDWWFSLRFLLSGQESVWREISFHATQPQRLKRQNKMAAANRMPISQEGTLSACKVDLFFSLVWVNELWCHQASQIRHFWGLKGHLLNCKSAESPQWACFCSFRFFKTSNRNMMQNSP